MAATLVLGTRNNVEIYEKCANYGEVKIWYMVK
jgi:hypothetical protein